jgi:hypothetical protein
MRSDELKVEEFWNEVRGEKLPLEGLSKVGLRNN